MAKQTSKFPNDPNMHTIALTVISAIPWAMGREQLLAFSDDLFMFFYGLLHAALYGAKSGLLMNSKLE